MNLKYRRSLSNMPYFMDARSETDCDEWLDTSIYIPTPEDIQEKLAPYREFYKKHPGFQANVQPSLVKGPELPSDPEEEETKRRFSYRRYCEETIGKNASTGLDTQDAEEQVSGDDCLSTEVGADVPAAIAERLQVVQWPTDFRFHDDLHFAQARRTGSGNGCNATGME